MKVKSCNTVNVVERFGNSLHIDYYFTKVQPLNKDDMKELIENIVKEIGMNIHKDVHIEYYKGRDEHTEGYSCMCFLDTSSLTVHTNPYSSRVYLDLFSCKSIDARKLIKYLNGYFKSDMFSFYLIDR